jgi:hypothetical protein
MDWNHKDRKNPPTYKIHGYDRRRLKKERADITRSIKFGWGDTILLIGRHYEINKLLMEPYGMVKYQVTEHTL